MAGKYARAADDAKAWAEEHDLERLITRMVNSTVTEKPSDPHCYMMRYLLESCTPEQVRQAGVKVARPLPQRHERAEGKSKEAYEIYAGTRTTAPPVVKGGVGDADAHADYAAAFESGLAAAETHNLALHRAAEASSLQLEEEARRQEEEAAARVREAEARRREEEGSDEEEC